MKLWFPMPETATGAEVFTLQLAQALSARGIETVVTRYSKQIEAMPWFLSAYRPPPNVDVVHLNAGSARGFLGHGIPSVITGHGAFELAAYDIHKTFPQKLYHSLLVRRGIKKAIGNANAVTAVSRWVADIYRAEYAERSVEVINNWVDAEIFLPVRKSLARKLLFVGRPAWQKGSHLLPELISFLGNDFDLTCTLGENEWPGKVPPNVHLIGPIDRKEMPGLYQTHDALVVPSIAEGFCIAAAEAMACGLPVFGFRGHGLDDALGACAPYTAADMPDIRGLAEQVHNVLGDPAVYQMISDQGRQHVIENLTQQKAVDAYLAIYHGLK